jgi:hypothetical protein
MKNCKVLASTTITKNPQPQYEVYDIASMPYHFTSGNSTDSSDIFEKCRQRKRKEAVNKKKKNTKMTKKQTAAKKKQAVKIKKEPAKKKAAVKVEKEKRQSKNKRMMMMTRFANFDFKSLTFVMK